MTVDNDQHEIQLDDFYKEVRKQLNSFVEEWRKKQEIEELEFPEEMYIEDWWDQFIAYLETK